MTSLSVHSPRQSRSGSDPLQIPPLGNPPFRGLAPQLALGGHAPASISSIHHPAKRYASVTKTTVAARSPTRAPLPTPAGPLAVAAPTQPSPAPSAHPPEPLGARTNLRYSQFKNELATHSDKAWVTRLLQGIDKGVNIGFAGPRTSMTARNLQSATLHADVIDRDLHREVTTGHILGPFPDKPLPTLQCLGLGVVPKKNGKWRVIMHLLAPPGHSTNDYIPHEQFTLTYATVDAAVRLLATLGKDSLMAKADLKVAFRNIPINPAD